jgi:glycosyltransferase involved in cell wall biosynthesis
MPVSVDICAATYRRPAMLRELLDSLTKQSLSDDITYRIIIADNDSDGSAKAIIGEYEKSCPVPLIYGWEPRRGISYARNCCLALAQSEWVAFVDDDETVAEDWSSCASLWDRDTPVDYPRHVFLAPAMGHGNCPNQRCNQQRTCVPSAASACRPRI